MTRIALDAMGGDHAPGEIVVGAVEAAAGVPDVKILLVGQLAPIQAELDKPVWILDGNMKRTLPHRLTYCDTVIWLDYSAPVCFGGAVKRIIQNYGKTRPDMGGNCPESFDKQKRQFLRSVWTFNRKNRPDFERMTAEAEERGVTVIRLKNRRQGERYLREIGRK